MVLHKIFYLPGASPNPGAEMGTGMLLGKPDNNCRKVAGGGLVSHPGGGAKLLAALRYGKRS